MTKGNLLKRSLVSFLLLASFLRLFAPTAFAQEVQLIPPGSGKANIETAPYTGQQYQVQQAGAFGTLVLTFLPMLVNKFYGEAEDAVNSGSWIASTITHILVSLNAIFLGDAMENFNNITPGPVPGPGGGGSSGFGFDYQKSNGLLAMTGGLVDGVMVPPDLHTAAFFKDTLADNLLSNKVYAADKRGTEFFEPIREIWVVFRNISYIFMALILTVMGLMVMLRYKIDPRTTMTVSAVLPKVAAAVILIAFSYPIAGFMFDLARVGVSLIDTVMGGQFRSMGFSGNLVPIEPFSIILALAPWFIPINQYLGGSGALALVLTLIFEIILLFVAFSLFFTLVIRIANLFMQVVFAPIAFMWGMMPGQGDTTSRWFKSFLVNALSFPVIYFLVNFALLILIIGTGGFVTGTAFDLPDKLGWAPFGATRNVAGLVAIGILIAATKVPEILEDALDVAPSTHAAKAGVKPEKLPLVGGFFK